MRADTVRTSKYLHGLARGVSQLLSPPCVAVAGILLAAAAQPFHRSWGCALAFIGVGVAGPLLAFWWCLSTGRVSDVDLSQRRERPLLFVIALLAAGAALGCLWALDAPCLMMRFAAAHATILATAMLVTLYWKISIHSVGATAMAFLLSTTYGSLTLVLTPVVLVGWSRLYLKRRTLPQVLTGGMLGWMIFLVLLPY